MAVKAQTKSVAVEIMGVTYHIRSDESVEYLRELAEIVDTKAKEIRRQTATVDSLKCAVLAALNLADDLCKLNKDYRSYRGFIENQQNRMIKTIDSALESGG